MNKEALLRTGKFLRRIIILLFAYIDTRHGGNSSLKVAFRSTFSDVWRSSQMVTQTFSSNLSSLHKRDYFSQKLFARCLCSQRDLEHL